MPTATSASDAPASTSFNRFMLSSRLSICNMQITYRESIIMSNPTDMSLSRSAGRLRVGVFAVMGLILLIYLAARFEVQIAHAHVEHQVEGVGAPYAQLIGDVSLILLCVALLRLSQMLGGIASGELFSGTVISHFRGFAMWLLVLALFELLVALF